RRAAAARRVRRPRAGRPGPTLRPPRRDPGDRRRDLRQRVPDHRAAGRRRRVPGPGPPPRGDRRGPLGGRPMSPAPARIALVGTRGFGAVHLRNLARLEAAGLAQLVGAVDVVEPPAELAALHHRSLADLLAIRPAGPRGLGAAHRRTPARPEAAGLAQLVGVVDVVEPPAELAAIHHRSLADLLAALPAGQRPEIVAIATPIDTHVPLATEALA